MKPPECPYRSWAHKEGQYVCLIPGGHPYIIDACTNQNDDDMVCSNKCPMQRNENHAALVKNINKDPRKTL